MDRFDLDMVFLGGLFPKATESEIISNSIGQIDNAANNLQWNLIKGFDANLKLPVKIINSLYIGSYPKKYKKPIINSYEFSHTDNSLDINVGFVNIVGLKHLSRFASLKPILSKWAITKSSKTKVIFAYALTSIFVELLCYVKKVNPEVVTVIIVPDLPKYMDTSNKSRILGCFFKSLSMNHINRKIANIDVFVLLTKYMIEGLGLWDKETVVMEGVASQPSKISGGNAILYSDNINIVYTGTMNARYGILSLIDAFRKIKDKKYRLILCGAGDSVSLVEDAARSDNRITYMGQLKRDDIINIQDSATLLVNPRQNNEEFTKYSFPSKIMEYLSSGKPVIAYKLDGMPDEYDNFIHYVEGNSIESLKNKLIEVAEQPNEIRCAFGETARNWILKEKNSITQTARIIEAALTVRNNTGKNILVRSDFEH